MFEWVLEVATKFTTNPMYFNSMKCMQYIINYCLFYVIMYQLRTGEPLRMPPTLVHGIAENKVVQLCNFEDIANVGTPTS